MSTDTFQLDLDFLTKNDCIMYAEDQNFFCGKLPRTLRLNRKSPTSETRYLTSVSTHAVLTRNENLLQYDFRNEDNSKINSYEWAVTPIDLFQGSSELWVAQTVLRDNEDYKLFILKILVHTKTPGSGYLILLSLSIEHFM